MDRRRRHQNIYSIVVHNPSAPVLGLGDDLVTNGNMETGDPPSSWIPYRTTLDSVNDERAGGSGLKSKEVTLNGFTSGDSSQSPNITLVVGSWYKITGWGKRGTASQAYFNLRNTSNYANWIATPSVGTIWGVSSGVGRCVVTAATQVACQIIGSDGANAFFDDVSLKNIAFSTAGLLTYLGQATTQNGAYSIVVTPSAGYHAGIVVHADSATAPTNCLHAYYDRNQGKAYFLKIVEGATTELKSATITYVAGAEIRIVSNGTTHTAYYNNTIIDSAQTALDVSSWGRNVFYFSTSATDIASFARSYLP